MGAAADDDIYDKINACFRACQLDTHRDVSVPRRQAPMRVGTSSSYTFVCNSWSLSTFLLS